MGDIPTATMIAAMLLRDRDVRRFFPTLGEVAAWITMAIGAPIEMDLDLLTARAAGFDVVVANRTDDVAVIGLMGPRAMDVLASCVEPGQAGAFPWLSARRMMVAGVDALVLRVSYVGELGFEFHVARGDAVRLFLALEQAGQPLGIGHYGAYAANSMRLEKGYRGWGMDLTTERSPLETGLAYLARPEGRSFVGRDAMLARAPNWDMVLLDIDTDGGVEPFYSHTVFAAGRPVGVVTSGAFGHRVRKSLALAFLRDPSARDGLSVKMLGRQCPARILDKPPYDPHNLKLKA